MAPAEASGSAEDDEPVAVGAAFGSDEEHAAYAVEDGAKVAYAQNFPYVEAFGSAVASVGVGDMNHAGASADAVDAESDEGVERIAYVGDTFVVEAFDRLETDSCPSAWDLRSQGISCNSCYPYEAY